MNKNLKVIELTIDELDETSGISLISIVDRPAIESNFIKLSEEPELVMLKSDQQKQYVTGPVLIPEKQIYRRNKDQEYFIKFSADTIEKIRNKFFKTGQLKLSNLDHSQNDQIEAYLIESWIVENPEKDKASALGFTDVQKGALYCTYYFPDSKVWTEVSQRNGFSLEGFFNEKLSAVLEPEKAETVESLLEELVKALSNDQ